MSSINHRHSKHHQRYEKKLTVRIGGIDGTVLVLHDRLAWALDRLIEVGETGVTPLDWPAPQWLQYVLLLRRYGLVIETVTELDGGPYAGRRSRYVLRTFLEILDREDAA